MQQSGADNTDSVGSNGDGLTTSCDGVTFVALSPTITRSAETSPLHVPTNGQLNEPAEVVCWVRSDPILAMEVLLFLGLFLGFVVVRKDQEFPTALQCNQFVDDIYHKNFSAAFYAQPVLPANANSSNFTSADDILPNGASGNSRVDPVPGSWRTFPDQYYYPLPFYQQQTDYTCGPSSAKSILLAYGLNISEDQLCEEMSCTPEDGTPWIGVASGLVQNGFAVEARYNSSILQMKVDLYQNRRWTIVDYQAWKYANDTTPWAVDWLDGHYSVFIGWNSTGIFLMDPSQDAVFYGYIPTAEFNARWHDGPPNYNHFSITAWVEGQSPVAPIAVPTTAQPTNVLPTL
jgi:hypothetical protein